MTKDGMRRLISEVFDLNEAEEALKEAIAESLDYQAIAEHIVAIYEPELLELAAEAVADNLLPF
jgi:dihydroneopterin aldolase